jgi:hypothetical protein
VIWLGLLAGGLVLLVAIAWVFRWASADPGVELESEKKSFQAEQDWRGLRRADKL